MLHKSISFLKSIWLLLSLSRLPLKSIWLLLSLSRLPLESIRLLLSPSHLPLESIRLLLSPSHPSLESLSTLRKGLLHSLIGLRRSLPHYLARKHLQRLASLPPARRLLQGQTDRGAILLPPYKQILSQGN